MFRLTSKIYIADCKLIGMVEMTVESSWQMQTDTCTVTLPKIIKWRDKPIYFDEENPQIKKGDPVTIETGYNDRNVVIFKGYVVSVNATVPITIECQDEMWLLKSNTQNLSFKDVDLQTLLSAIIPKEISFEAAEIRLGRFRVSNSTPAQVLDFLRKNYFLKSWFRDSKLYVNVLPILYDLQEEYKMRFDLNIISHNLTYQKSEDTKIKLKVISMLPNNEKIEVEIGDPDGQERTLHLYDVKEPDMKLMAEKEIDLMRYTGYRGDFLTFLEPHIKHGDIVELIDDIYPERQGKYQVRKVITTFGISGGRQTVELGIKVG